MPTSLKQAFSGGNGGLVSLTADPNWPANNNDGKTVLSFTGTGASQVLLNLSGKYAVSFIALQTNSAGNIPIYMEVDGNEIWNSTAPSDSIHYLYSSSGSSGVAETSFIVDSSLILSVVVPNGTAFTLTYLARPIL